MTQLSQMAASGQTTLMQSTGNPRLDLSFGMMLANMANTFAVRPGFAFYNDGNRPNALALRDSYLPNTQGTVLLGRGMLFEQARRSANGDIPLIVICAHEFGHIVQYANNCHERLNRGQKTVKRTELHADFLAGYFLGSSNAQFKIVGNSSSVVRIILPH